MFSSVAVVAGATASALAQFGGYAPPRVIPMSGGEPSDVVLADFDGDTDLDAALPLNRSGSSGQVAVLINPGAGDLEPPDLYTIGSGPTAIAAGDIDLDGDVDLVVTNGESDSISVLFNDGFGAFPVALSLSVGDQPSAVALADFDSDRKLDIAVANAGDDTVSLVTFDIPTGQLITVGGFSTNTNAGDNGHAPVAIAAADINGDGQIDLATVNNDSDTLTVFTHSAGFAFFFGDLARFIPAGDTPTDLAIGDIDGDGANDYCIANGPSDTIRVVFNDGAGDADTTDVYDFNSVVFGLVLADLDPPINGARGDGDLDIALTRPAANNEVGVLFNNGVGNLDVRDQFDGGGVTLRIDAGDIDGDGDIDLVCNSTGPDALIVLENLTNVVDGPLPLAVIQFPSDVGSVNGALCPGVHDIVGSATTQEGFLADYVLEFRETNSSAYVPINADTEPVVDDVLGQWDTSLLPEGLYLLRLTATTVGSDADTAERMVWLSSGFDTVDVDAPLIVAGEVCVLGTVADDDCGPLANNCSDITYEVDFANVGSSSYSPVDPGNIVYQGVVIDGVLATWDTTDTTDGDKKLRVIGTNRCGEMRTSEIVVEVDNDDPIARLDSPAACSAVLLDQIVSIDGEVFDDNLLGWTLDYTGGSGTGWVEIASGSSNIDGEIATWDTTGIEACALTLRLRVFSEAVTGCRENVVTTTMNSIVAGCGADLNQDGVVDFFDVQEFLVLFNSACQ